MGTTAACGYSDQPHLNEEWRALAGQTPTEWLRDELRDPAEITHGYGGRTAPEGVNVYNPAFDVTPHENITGIVTEFGVIERPDTEAVHRHFKQNGLL